MICSHLVNLSLLLGAVLSYGLMWPLISEHKGDWYPATLKESNMKSLNGYKVFISIALILGDGLYNFLKILYFTSRSMYTCFHKRTDKTTPVDEDNQPPEVLQRNDVFIRESIPLWLACIGYVLFSIISIIFIPLMFPQLKWYYVVVAYIIAPALSSSDPNSWALSHFSTHPRCDVLVNNINESCNAYILDARDNGIINMLKWIRRRLMTRFQVKRTEMLAYKGPFGPRIQKKFDKNKRYSRGCFPRYAGEGEFEVDEDDRTFFVHLNDKTCGCRLWALSGIPCKHAVAAIWANREQPEAYVHPCYSKEVYLQTYSYIIHQVPTHHEWEISELPKIEPPTYKKSTGRPRNERRRGADEPKDPHKSSKKNLTVTCSRCLTLGHNSRACKKPPHPDSKLMKKSGTSKGDKCGTSKTTEKGKEKMPQKGPSKSTSLFTTCSFFKVGTTRNHCFINVGKCVIHSTNFIFQCGD